MEHPALTDNEETLLQRAKKKLKFTKQEILLILRSYLSHPTRWIDIIQAIKDNSDQLNRDVRELYQSGSEKQLKDRVSTKMKKLMALDDIEDDDIRVAVQSIKELEMRHVRPQQGQQQIRDARDNIAANLSPSSSEEDEPEQVDLPGPATRPRRRTSKRPLADIIRENQLLYNNFIKKKMPKLLRELGVSSDSSESDS